MYWFDGAETGLLSGAVTGAVPDGDVEGVTEGLDVTEIEGEVLGLAETACVGVGEGAGVAMGTVNDWVTYWYW